MYISRFQAKLKVLNNSKKLNFVEEVREGQE